MAQACFAGDVSWPAGWSGSRYNFIFIWFFYKRSEPNPLPNPAWAAGIPLKAPGRWSFQPPVFRHNRRWQDCPPGVGRTVQVLENAFSDPSGCWRRRLIL